MLVDKKNLGFSLIEVLVFISAFAVFFVVAISAVTITLRNMKINEHKILATRYAEELQEWVRAEKEIDWNSFYSRSTSNIYCFNSALSTTWPTASASGCNNSYIGIVGINPEIFKRELTLRAEGTSQINTSITVSWREAGQTLNVTLTSIFNPWE